MNIKMDTGGVNATGDDMHQVAGTANERTKSLFATSDTAASDNPGWLSAAALTAVKDAWQTQFGKLVQQTVAAGDALKDSAGTVATADQEAENRLDHVMHDLAGQ